MTRAELLTEYLTGYVLVDDPDHLDVLVSCILGIADDRTLLNHQMFADRIRRSHATLRSWRLRGQHEIPEPAGHWGDHVAYWDVEQVNAWAAAHPELLGE